MVIRLKENFYKFIKSLNYNITDTGEYVEKFPWLMLRLANDQYFPTPDTNVHRVVFTLDVFSKYPGEKEILEIAQSIASLLPEFQAGNPEVLYAYQKSFKILDDKATGPVKKHGVINYEFVLGQGLIPEEEETPDEIE